MSTAAPRPIRFVHQGQIREVKDLPPTTTVLQWLREVAHCTGTKEGCAEGDCGACTVVVGERHPDTGQWQQKTVNACIQFLPTLDGKALLTVEDLQSSRSAQPHPCQQAMVDCHGSQCGFCTPGFVMSLWDIYQTHEQAPSRAELADALSGNLCRCTGYRPILDAGEKMFDGPRQPFSPEALLQQLATLQKQSPDGLEYEGPSQTDSSTRSRFFALTALNDLAALRQAMPEARLLAGSTDVGLWVTKQFKALGDIIYLGQVPELRRILTPPCQPGEPEMLDIGAAVTLEEAWSNLAARMPALRELWLRFASPPVRHAGTLVGNLANGSPIGDSAPILLALDATLVLRAGPSTRELPLSAFYLDYMKNALLPGEFIQSVRVPMMQTSGTKVLRAYKISKRRDSDISAVCAGLYLQLDGELIQQARLGWGGMAGTARRARQTEAALIGLPWTEATLRQAQAALAQDFQPMSDLRASKDYRLKVAANLLERFWLETRPHNPLRADEVQVWPAQTA
ncbi:MAG: xanthine dehydrogenase small subunit [Aquabacterium sp.]|uniref:xanthine dehydrogenase small subunit n=1 Tax=Aquabacterium sp. TaxID=1872578 RepID=UPI00121D7D8B|nr:xanthine dehydrogenase small subunit [Aquabacterium sp.]TAK94835.1 MAG: xanthine dehydrogenase small subunit [Aquabacterium sp.]